jgi:hypothetical protein
MNKWIAADSGGGRRAAIGQLRKRADMVGNCATPEEA